MIFIFIGVVLIVIISSEIIRLQGHNSVSFVDFYSSGMQIFTPYNAWCQIYSQGPNASFPDMDVHFPNHKLLQENWEIIRDEGNKLYNSNKTTMIKYDSDLLFKYIADDGWKKFYIKWYGPITNEALLLCPNTCKLIEQLPEITFAMFSIVEPGSSIAIHMGIFKGSLTYHLGLVCPEDTYLIVDNIKYFWKNSEDILFDDTYLHSVKNESNESRIVLLCHIKRKMRTPIATSINNFIIKYFCSLTSKIK